MWIEMNDLNLELYSNTKTQKATTTHTVAEVPNIQSDTELKNPPSTELSLQLQKFQQKIKEAPIVNEDKVNTLKKQISEGTYGILNTNIDIVKESAMRIADKMLNLENDLFGKKR